ATANTTCGPGPRNGLCRGRTKEQDQKGGQDALRSCSLNPNRHLSTKPGQAQGSFACRILARSYRLALVNFSFCNRGEADERITDPRRFWGRFQRDGGGFSAFGGERVSG